MNKHLLLFLLLGNLVLWADDPVAPAPAKRPPQYLIVLHLTPRLHNDKAWTDDDNAAVTAHFNRLKAATDAGQVLLAGRTDEPLDRTLGLIIFTAPDEATARVFMLGDPCVVAGVMTAELHPYTVALRAR